MNVSLCDREKENLVRIRQIVSTRLYRIRFEI